MNEHSVLTRMRLSCCWGDNLNEKELNEVVDYINHLQRENKQLKERDKYKSIVDELKEEINRCVKANVILDDENSKLQSRINKAIEFIESGKQVTQNNKGYDYLVNAEKILEILRGVSNE